MLRPAIHSGTWYPSKKSELMKYLDPAAKKTRAIAAVCPHAGWIYSGKTAGQVFSMAEPADIYVVIGPNHRGEGSPVSVYPEGTWETPLGELEIDAETASSIIDNSEVAAADPSAHLQEHSLEVQMPFIKLSNPSGKIVPICMYDYGANTCMDLGRAVSNAVKKKSGNKKFLIVASTDMSHYVSASYAKEIDAMAIEKILNLDPAGLLRTVVEKRMSMCGSGPVAAALWAAKELGASGAKLVNYSNSGEATGDYNEVVGYAGLIIS